VVIKKKNRKETCVDGTVLYPYGVGEYTYLCDKII
jgi:hypothetical protein